MGFKDRLKAILDKIYEKHEENKMITMEELVLIIEDVLNVGGPTAKKYVDELVRRGLLASTSAMTFTVLPKKDVDGL